MYPILRPFFNKGGAGRSLSRPDTVDAVNPLIERHVELLAVYDRALLDLADRDAAAKVETVMNRLRTELAKLKEVVLSNGGVPFNGVGRSRRAERLADSDGGILHAVIEAETAYREALRETLAYPHHQIRTIAILENNATGSTERLGVLNPIAQRAPRRASAPPAAPVDEVTTLPADLPHTTHHAGPDEQPLRERRERDA